MISEEECLMIGRAIVRAMRLRRDPDFKGEIPIYLEYRDDKNRIEFSHWRAGEILFSISGLRGNDLTVSFEPKAMKATSNG